MSVCPVLRKNKNKTNITLNVRLDTNTGLKKKSALANVICELWCFYAVVNISRIVTERIK